ncbi:MAG: SEC-C domain-containing protein [bacterium]|nr:SEC-C domain-containing protein [bacterium]
MIETPDPQVPLTSPCPCGSGRKYRRCCWPKEKRRAAEARAAIHGITPQVGAYATSFEEELPEFESIFFGPMKERFSKEELGEFIRLADDAVKVTFFDILAADYVMYNGRTPIDVFLDDPKASGHIHPAAREYVEGWGRASMSLYEVQDLIPGESLVLKDLLTRRSVTVLERSASQSLLKWSALFTRVVRIGDVGLITGPVLEVPRRKLEWAIDSLKRAKDEPGDRSVTWARFFKKHWDYIPFLWFLMWVSPHKGMELVNIDGDELREISVEYTLVPGGGARASARLNAMEELSEGGRESWSWIEDRDRGTMENVSVAMVSLEGDTVVLRVNSSERESKVRKRVDDVLSELVVKVERSDEVIDMEAMGREATSVDGEQEGDPIPLDVQRQVVHEMLATHYRRWLDEPVPVLDDLTPREAVAKRSHRQRVISLLKNLEDDAARRTPEDPGASFSFSWLWRELKLRRP